jgi:hypothetical protein
MGRALPCLIRIVAACPRSRSIRVCASHNKTFPGREAFILIQPGRRDPCSRDWPGYAASERPFWMPLAGASGRWPVPSGGYPVPCRLFRRGDTRSRAATAARRQAPGRSYPGPLRLPGPVVSPDLCTPGKRTAGPRTGKRTAGPQTAKRTAGPRTIQSGGQRCDPAGPPPAPELEGVHAGLSGSKRVGADLRRQRAALGVARHSAARRGLPTGVGPLPPRQN